MKLLSLNLWAGMQGEALFSFLKQQSATVDVFFFQEVMNSKTEQNVLADGSRPKLFFELSELLSDFQGFFCSSVLGFSLSGPVDFSAQLGLATFVRKIFLARGEGKKFIAGNPKKAVLSDKTNEPEILQYMQIKAEQGNVWLINLKGKWYPGEKLDTPERITQSQIILDTLNTLTGPKVMAGDFNLMPKTESIRMIEKEMENLIQSYNIENTRNKNSWQEHPEKQYFADYTFVSPEIKVKSFEVPYNEVSDHLPMILEFEI